MSDNFTENLSRGDNWLRVLMVAVYAFIFWLGLWVACLVVILNLVVLLITGARNDQLADFGRKLADYLHTVLRYATQVTDEKPFPFADDHATPTDVAETTPAAAQKPAKAPAPQRAAKPAEKAAPEPAAEAPEGSAPKSAAEPAPEPAAKPAGKAAPKPAAKKKKSAPRKKKAVKKVSSDDSGTA